MSLKNFFKNSIDKLNNLAVSKSYPSPTPSTQEKNPEVIKRVYFHVAGVSVGKRQDFIKKFVSDAKKEGVFEPYNGMTNKEIIEYGDNVYEASYLNINTLRLEPTEIRHEDAINVYIKDFHKKEEYLIGCVEKEQIEAVFDILEDIQNNPNHILEADAYITGGNLKRGVENDDGKVEVVTDHLYYGISVTLKVYGK